MALGEYPTVSLVQTRERQFAARRVLAGGHDPMAERRSEAEARLKDAKAIQYGNAVSSSRVTGKPEVILECCQSGEALIDLDLGYVLWRSQFYVQVDW
jgi:hypothetical protein